MLMQQQHKSIDLCLKVGHACFNYQTVYVLNINYVNRFIILLISWYIYLSPAHFIPPQRTTQIISL